MPATRPIRLLFYDASAATRRHVAPRLAREADIELLGIVVTPSALWAQLDTRSVDVLVLDVDTPALAGLEVLQRLMRQAALPVIVFTPRSWRSEPVRAQALALGVCAVVDRPQTMLDLALNQAAERLLLAVRRAGRERGVLRAQPKRLAPMPLPSAAATPSGRQRIVAIGASMGGVKAIEQVLLALAPPLPPILIVQHMPAEHTGAFAERLDALCALTVCEARGGEALRPGLVLIAPGNRHLRVVRCAGGCQAALDDGAPVSRHRPSVDVLFASLLPLLAESDTEVLAIVLTGMGEDGAAGLLDLRQAGAATIAQDEASSAVFGMPRIAIALGGAERVLPLAQIAPAIDDFATGSASRRTAAV